MTSKAVPAYRGSINALQPDGTTITFILMVTNTGINASALTAICFFKTKMEATDMQVLLLIIS